MTPRRETPTSPDVFTVDPTSPVPVFRQLHDAVVTAIGEGRLHPGQQLPTVRALAAAREIAPNTVAKAYRELEASGAIEGRGRAGTFVRLGTDPLDAAAREIAVDAVRAFTKLGVDRPRAEHLLADAYAAQAAACTAP